MMPSVSKYHIFKEKNFQGLVYCDYCAKLLWGLSRQGVQCTECGYNCHTSCSDLVIQCRPQRRWSPDSLSVTDSEAESVSKYSIHSSSHHHNQQPQQSHRASFDRHNTMDSDNHSIHSTSSRKPSSRILLDSNDIPRNLSSSKLLDESAQALKSPTFPTTPSSMTSSTTANNDSSKKNKSYRKSLKQQLQQQQQKSSSSEMSPHATAKAFTRLVARSRAFFYIGNYIHDIYSWKKPVHSIFFCLFWICSCLNLYTVLLVPPLIIVLLYTQTAATINKPAQKKKTASEILFPRFDENTPEYYNNLENMQYAFVFFIRLYDNFAYHLQHITLNSTTYKVLFVTSLCISTLFYVCGKYLVMTIGLMVLLNKTFVGTSLEAILLFLMEFLQIVIDLVDKLNFFKKKQEQVKLEPIQVSVYENQRWWAGGGYTSQLLRSERSGWSNITGQEPLPPKEEMPSPNQYTWADDDWKLDTTGPWADDALEIVSLIECDENGWVYTDHRWSNPRGRPELMTGRAAAIANGHTSTSDNNTRALTRRRRWYRTAKPIAQKDDKKAL